MSRGKSDQDGVNRTADIPRIYHYPTKFRKGIPAAPSTPLDSLKSPSSTTTENDSYVAQTEYLSASPAPGNVGPAKVGSIPVRQRVTTIVSSVRRRSPNLRKDGFPKWKSSYLWYLLVPLFIAAWVSWYTSLPPAVSQTEEIIGKVVDPAEIKTYIRQQVEHIAKEDKHALEKSHLELSERTKSLQTDVHNILNTINQLGNDIASKESTTLKGLKDELLVLDARIGELKTHQLTIDEVRRITEAAGSKNITEELEQLKAEISSKITSYVRPVGEGEQPNVAPSSYDEILQEIGKLKENLQNKEQSIQTQIEEKLKALVQKTQAELESKLTTPGVGGGADTTVEALNLQINILREKLNGLSESDEISPKIHNLVQELVKENIPTTLPQGSEKPIDEGVIQKFVDEAIKELSETVKAVSSGLSSLGDDVTATKQHTQQQLSQKETELAGKIDGIISDKLRSLPQDASSVAQLEAWKKDILLEVRKMFIRHKADQIARVDWALATIGAAIVPSRTSETYSPVVDQNPWQKIESLFLGPPQGYPPTVLLTPDTSPGKCWAFRGQQGHVAVKLPVGDKLIFVTDVTIDHIDSSIAPNVNSAPKDCIVWGLTNETSPRIEMGRFSYDISSDEVVQSFALENPGAYPIIMLEVLSNHGFEEYTCIYRIRVHGERIAAPQPPQQIPTEEAEPFLDETAATTNPTVV